jgi:outer membrane lipoprotein-sorting protein
MKNLIIILAIILQFVGFAFAAEPKSGPSPLQIEIYKNDISRIEQYLNGIKTFVSPFSQEDSAGKKSDGTFYLSRPGKLRWEYSPPTPILIIAKGSLLTYYDSELDEVSHVGLEDSLSGFLTRDVISFSDEDIEILKFTKEKGDMNVTIAQKGKEEEGALTLTFDANKVELKQMTIVDSIGKETRVWFDSPVYDKPLDKALFTLPKVKRR